MKKNKYYFIRDILIVTVCLFGLSSFNQKREVPPVQVNILTAADSLKQKAILEKILSQLPPDNTTNGRVSFLDETFQDWIKRTRELPPDFDKMPSIPFLPDPLVMD